MGPRYLTPQPPVVMGEFVDSSPPTVAQALEAAVRFRDRRSRLRKYSKADLRWDLEHGYVEMVGVEAYRGRVGGEELEFEMSDSEYADDTALILKDQE